MKYTAYWIKLSLTAEINFLVRDLLQNADFSAMKLLESYVVHAQQLKLSLNTKWIQGHVVFLLETWLKEVVDESSSIHLVQLSNLIHLCDIMGIDIDKAEIQNSAYDIYKKYRSSSNRHHSKEWQPYIELFKWLEFHPY